MRVLFVAHSFPRWAGDVPGNFLHRLARALQGAGVEVRVVAPAAPGLPAREIIDGVPVARYRYAPRSLETLAYTGTMADAVRGSWGARAALAGLLGAAAVATRREATSWRADVVHAHWWFPGGASVAIPGATSGRPMILTLHGSDVRLARGLGPARAAYERVARRAAVVTAASRWLCAEATAMAPAVACRVARMPVAADVFTPPAAGAPRDGILFVGRFTRQKGVDALLRAVQATDLRTPVTLVGSGPEEARLRALAGELGIGGQLTWVASGTPHELAALYRRALALAVPSTEEGLGLVAVEAALCGTPTVGFASGGLPDVVEDGVTGFLVPPGDHAALGRALASVLADPERGAAMGAQARVLVGREFTPEVTAAQHATLYADVAAASARGARPRGGR